MNYLYRAIICTILFYTVQINSQVTTPVIKPGEMIKPPHHNEDVRIPAQEELMDYYRSTETVRDKWDGALWEMNERYIYSYNENNYTTEYKTQKRNGSNWVDTLRTLYIYDNNNITAYSYQKWNGSMWLNNYRYAYTYNAAGYTTVYLYQIGDSLNWVNSSRSVYYRNSNNDTDSIISQSWQASAWKNTYKYVNNYDSQGDLTSEETYTWDNVAMEWKQYGRTLHDYDEMTFSYSYTFQTWNGTEYVNYYRYFYYYNSENKFLGDLYQTWDGTTWINEYRSVYTYNAQGQYEEIKYESWDGAVWEGYYRYLYYYDSNGSNTERVYQTYTMGDWKNSSRNLYVRNSNNLITTQTTQTWDGTVWVNNYRYSYTYELVVSTEENELVSDFRLFNNYPNPFNPSTTIRFSVSDRSFVSIKVYDILGKEVAVLINTEKEKGQYNIEFNASALSSGIYFYRLDAAPIDGQSGIYSEIKKMTLLK